MNNSFTFVQHGIKARDFVDAVKAAVKGTPFEEIRGDLDPDYLERGEDLCFCHGYEEKRDNGCAKEVGITKPWCCTTYVETDEGDLFEEVFMWEEVPHDKEHRGVGVYYIHEVTEAA